MQAIFLKSLTNIEELPRGEKTHIAFVGRSNVGKSSLINHLAQQKNLARVSSESGRTQTINLFDIDKRYFLVDLPGYGYAKTSKEKRMGFSEILSDYLSLVKQLKLVFVVIDAKIGPTDLDHDLLDQLATKQVEVVMILNKADKLSRSQIATLKQKIQIEYPGMHLIPHSSLSTMGRGEILQFIDSTLKKLKLEKKNS